MYIPAKQTIQFRVELTTFERVSDAENKSSLKGFIDPEKYGQFNNFDTKTSSWVKTPSEIRELDGSLFCDRHYGRVFVYHNGAQSYYAAWAFRGLLRV